MLNSFEIAETISFEKDKQKEKYKHLNKKLERQVYPQLRENPFWGRNIKKLKGEFEGIYRYRIGDFRILYMIDKKRVIVFMLNIIDRKDSY